MSHLQEERIWDWRVGSAVKNTSGSFRGPGFNFQHPQGSSQLIVTLVLGDMISMANTIMYIK